MKKISFLLVIVLLFILTACNSYSSNGFIAMNTYMSVTIYNDSNFNKHFNDIKGIYNNISRIADNSKSFSDINNICKLNNNRTIEYDEVIADMLIKANELKELTNGYFNPLISDLADLWKDAISKNEILSNEVISYELDKMNNSRIEIKEDSISIIGDANIDLGAFAKGYATELVKEYLEENKIKYYLINAGDSNVLLSTKINKYFKVALSKPFSNEAYDTLNLKNIAIATSSPKYQYFEKDNVRYHHLISPFTGMPINNYSSVNVLGSNSMICDVLSTAYFLMSEEEIIETSKNFDGYDYILCSDDEIIYKS